MKRLLFLSQFRLLYRHPWTTLSLVFGLILGVASVVAVHVVSARIEASLERFTSAGVTGVTHLITRANLSDGDYFDLRDRWRRAELPGIAAMTPVVEASVDTSRGRATLVGSDWLTALPPSAGDIDNSASGANDWRGTSAAFVGTELEGEDGFVIAGHRLNVVGRVPGRRVLVDIGTYHRLTDGLTGGLTDDLPTGQQRVTKSQTRLSYIATRFEDPWRWPRNLLNRLMPGLKSVWPEPDGGELALDAGWRIAPIVADQATLQFGRSVLFNLGALGLLALVVAWLLLYQVAIIWHRQRQRLLERLSHMGAQDGVLVRHFVLVFAIIGVACSGVALVIGVEFANALVQLVADGAPGGPEPGRGSAGSPYDGWVATKALISGVVVATVAATMAATRRSAEHSIWLTVICPVCAVLLLAVMGSGLIAGFLLIVALCWLAGGLVGRLLKRVKNVDGWLSTRLLITLGVRDVHHYRGDLVVALLALAMAVATTIAMGLMVSSFRTEFETTLQARLSDDLFVSDIAITDRILGRRLTDLAEVQRVQAYGRIPARVAGQRLEVGFTEFGPDEAERYSVDPAALRVSNAALVNDQFVARYGLGVGDEVRIDMEGVAVDVLIAANFKGFGDAGPRLLVDVAMVPMALRQFDRLSVRTRDPQTTTRMIERLAPGANVQNRAGLKTTSLDIFDRTFAITRALTLVALIVGTLGIYNSLVMLRLNQSLVTRLFDHLGLSRWEVARIQLVRSLIVAGLAMAVALPLGVAMAWVLCNWINPAAFGWRIDLTINMSEQLFGPVVFGLLAALAAALVPIPKVADDLG